MHVCAVAAIAGISRVIVPSLSSVYSAFGIGTADVVHTYRGAVNGTGGVIEAMERRALIDMKGEGFPAASVDLAWSGAGKTGVDTAEIAAALAGKPAGSTAPVSLKATAPLPKVGFAAVAGTGSAAPRTSRMVTWQDGTARATAIYAADAVVAARGALAGPAIVEARDTTLVVPPGWRLEVDGHGQFVLARAA